MVRCVTYLNTSHRSVLDQSLLNLILDMMTLNASSSHLLQEPISELGSFSFCQTSRINTGWSQETWQ